MEALQRRGSNHRWRLRVSQISTACGGGCPQPKLGIHVSDLTVSSSSSDIVRICYFRETLCKCRSNSFADSAGFVLFFDVVAGPSPAIGEVEFSLLCFWSCVLDKIVSGSQGPGRKQRGMICLLDCYIILFVELLSGQIYS
ncbi:uncharacterized protein LOC124678853 isoform X1 [Lolium rigidum]|uniref:uncharacterized protein LOC124678853 isoform X1 n=1 Tax=Lolium rigidum TaxID=89674 RepID=UPI001F5C4F83|nr:uncharacterized protein LOC124678853 isoform X1 [Lolium rigidum]XP_047070658.1 uncharacterized protein LOC124678853 isoform X1 [Lolium rigidum]